MERTRVLNAGIGLSNLNTGVVDAGCSDAGTQRAELGIVNGVEKALPAREHLRPSERPIDGLRRSSRCGNQARVAGVGNEQAVRPKRDSGGKVRDLVREDLTGSSVY